MRRPIEIIGGGLAGLALGLALRRRDVPVTVYEAGHYPRHRVCGEFIAGLDPATIHRLGLAPVLADAARHREVTWFRNERAVQKQVLPQEALGLSRFALDARLAAAFVAENGILLVDVRRADAAPAAGRVLAAGRRRARSPWIGLKVHLDLRGRATSPFARGLEVHLGRQAYVGVSAVEGHRVNLCGFFHRQAAIAPAKDGAGRRFHGTSDQRLPALLLDQLHSSGLGKLAERVAPFIDAGSFCAVAGLRIDRTVRPGPGLSIGDACAMIPPFTGDGMAMAFQSAEAALDPLLAYTAGDCSWTQAVDCVRSALRRRFAVRLASAGVLHPFLLQPRRQRWLAAAARAGALPVKSLYTLLHGPA